MNLIDSHSHLFLPEFADDLPQVMQRAREAGVTHIFMPNIDSTTVQPLLEVCSRYAGYCFPMAGLHPTSVDANYSAELAVVKTELQRRAERGYVAVGEIGLDLYWDKTYLEEQLHVFEQQLEWALEYDLPVVIHSREAFAYIYKVLQRYQSAPLRGIFHSFTGNAGEAEALLRFPGFMFGINGVVTFKKSALPEVLPRIPLDRVVVETDSPYLTPVPNRGKRNESARVKDTLLKVAEVYRVSADEVAESTSNNALKVFGMLNSGVKDFKVY